MRGHYNVTRIFILTYFFMWYQLVFCSFKWKIRRRWKTWWDIFTNFVLKEWKQFSKNKDHHYFLALFLFHNADRLLLQDNTILLRLGSLKNNLFFTIWVMFWSISKIFFSFFRIQNIKTNCQILFLKVFVIRGIYIWSTFLRIFMKFVI